MQVNQEISDAITSVQLGNELDDDELIDELNAMEQEDLDNKMLSAPAAPVTATPNTQISSGAGQSHYSIYD
jgi:charged multivesicular body protein 4